MLLYAFKFCHDFTCVKIQLTCLSVSMFVSVTQRIRQRLPWRSRGRRRYVVSSNRLPMATCPAGACSASSSSVETTFDRSCSPIRSSLSCRLVSYAVGCCSVEYRGRCCAWCCWYGECTWWYATNRVAIQLAAHGSNLARENLIISQRSSAEYWKNY